MFDALILQTTALLVKKPLPFRRLVFASFVASLLVWGSFTPYAGFVNHPLFKLAYAGLIVLVAFSFRNLRVFLRRIVTFFLVSFLFGGGLIGAYYFIQFDDSIYESYWLTQVQGFGDPLSWLWVLVGFPVIWWITGRQADQWTTEAIRYDQEVSVTVTFFGQQITVKGLVDSGNRLADPISKKPVMILSLASVGHLLTDEIRKVSEDPNKYLEGDVELPGALQAYLRLIPYQTVDRTQQFMVAWKVERIEITSQSATYDASRALVAFTADVLASDGSFEAIVHPKMMSEANVLEDAS